MSTISDYFNKRDLSERNGYFHVMAARETPIPTYCRFIKR